MRPITVTDYLKEHFTTHDFDFLDLLKSLDPNPADRPLIEEEIRSAVAAILENAMQPTGLKNLASKIAVSDFRILRSNEVDNYWRVLHLQSISMRNAAKLYEESLKRLGAQTRSRSKQPKQDMLHESDGVMLSGMKTSAGSIIKTQAARTAKDFTYETLNDEQKNTVCCGLNSIVDLSNNSKDKDSQRSQFTDEAWQELKNRVYVSRTMPSPSPAVEEALKELEKLAKKDIKKAYRLSLTTLADNVFSEDEPYFEIYAHILRLMTRENSILYDDTKKRTEQDYLGQVWTPIFASVFNDTILKLKWGDSVTTESTLAKKRLFGDEGGAGCLGDRIDVRVVTTIQDRDYDVVNGEFASIVTGEGKFFADHRKVLRESKLIVDSIAGNTNTNRREIPRIIVPSFQATGLDGEIMVLKRPAPGLYTAQHIGSIPIPSDVSNLKWLRTKCIPRLMFMKKHAIKNAKILSAAATKDNRAKRLKSKASMRSPSAELDEEVGINNSERYVMIENWIHIYHHHHHGRFFYEKECRQDMDTHTHHHHIPTMIVPVPEKEHKTPCHLPAFYLLRS
ncbi:hypothetical protein RO3G_06604 [Lichtheimia corymbifera JMRC:FSU:9682]|uniref:Uncharacterized protein n=1 Tax=Lichtheimia corymbifera JMRC:FSU:9682 TaxID=1263082 RepID=A0A068RID2_9FUNG|nr:hypothetical protein RO3G_06604 [Lichtheimia corymbifera JMRC:FSU:9682]